MDRQTAKITVVVLAVLFVGLLFAGLFGGDDSEDADPGCAIYSDFVAGDDNPSDPEAIAVLREVEDATNDDEVRRFAIALRAALEDRADISITHQGLARACDL